MMPTINKSEMRKLLSGMALLLAMAWLPARAQSAPPAPRPAPPPAVSYRIAGTVVSASSGDPLRHATVAALNVSDSHTVASVESDSEGRFALVGLPENKYQLTASKRGYLTAFYDEHEEFSTAIVTGPDQETENLTFRLSPGAVLRGVVSANGDPVENAQVMLFMKPRHHSPGAKIVQLESALTDDMGAYDFGNLAAGEYLLAVKAQPWYGLHKSEQTESNANEALDVAYPITFFDSTTDEASATPIVLAGGRREEANMSLHPVPALHLTVEAPHAVNGAGPVLYQSIFGIQLGTGSGEIQHPASDASEKSAIEFSGVAPGHYQLEQGDPPRMLELDATTSQQVDPSLGAATVGIRCLVQSGTGAAIKDAVILSLAPAEGTGRSASVPMTAHAGGAATASATPGSWDLVVSSQDKNWQVQSIAVNGKSHPGSRFMVRDRPLSLVATLTDSTTAVEGFARRKDKGVSGVMMVLVPKDWADLESLARRDQTDSDGSFSLRDVVPGAYTVVAIQDGWELDWSRPEVLARYLPGGETVTVTEQSGKMLTLPEDVPVQAR